MTVLFDYAPAWLGLDLVQHTFIETGTYHGVSLAQACRHAFKRLVTIDVDAGSQIVARERVGVDFRVEWVCGSSPDVLPSLMRAEDATTFWLDAHYTGHGRELMDARFGECPLLLELAAIRAVPWRVPPIILIDDAHMYSSTWWETNSFATHFDRSQWPTLEEIADAMAPSHYLTVREGIVYLIAAQ